MKDLRGMTYDDILAAVSALGEKPYRASQIYSWVYKKGAASIDSMTDVSKETREKLKGLYFIGEPNVVGVEESTDGTRKFLTQLQDGARIESVIIPEGDRAAICVSTQAGCALGCAFCATGMAGFSRNLEVFELTGQVFSAMRLLKPGERLTNVVLMGMGEPMNNYDSALALTRILTDGAAFGLSHNRVTISTAGHAPGIRALAKDSNVNLAVSLNAADDRVRAMLMPISRKYPLSELVGAMREYARATRKHITIEYVLIRGVNDSPEDARKLALLLKGIRKKINLIPFNPFPGTRYKRPEDERAAAFGKVLLDAGYTVMVRSSRGSDISAACGQLSGGPREPNSEPKNVDSKVT